jgi:hypothetical protein
MIYISTLSDTRFTLNGTEYLKNYISTVKGSRIELFNCYERKDMLVPLTDCTQISLNGSVYETAEELQSALLTVTYSRFTMGDGSAYMQNNKGRIISLGYLTTENAPYNEVLSKINGTSFIITETESPVLVSAFKTENGLSKKHTFLFLGGKGTWGLNASPIASFNLVQLAPETLTVADLQENDNSVIISLPEISEDDFLATANTGEHDFTNTAKTYYFSYVEDEILYIKRFIGESGIYGGTGLLFADNDFISTTTGNIEPGPATPTQDEVTQAGNIIDNKSVIFTAGSGSLEISNEGFDYTNNNRVNIRFAEGSENESETITYTIPHKGGDDNFAMISDINNLNFERVLQNGNNAATPIFINNYQINPEYDAVAEININGKINLNSNTACTIIGKGAGKSNSGSYNTLYGAYAGFSNTTGRSNVAIGYSTQWQSVTGSYNIAIGHNTLGKSNSDSNVAIGYISLMNLSDGIRNSVIGRAAGLALTTGNSNVIYGYQALATNIDGSLNTVIGCSAMQNATTGNSNIWIGGISSNNYSINVSHGSYNTFIGTDLMLTEAEKTGNNQILIADGQGNRAIEANTQAGTVKIMGKNVLLIDSNSPLQSQNIWINDIPAETNPDTLYFIEDTSDEYFGEYSAAASGNTVINIPHHLNTIPMWVSVTPANLNAAGSFFIDKDEVNIILTYLSAPSGTLKFNIAYKS